MEKKINIAELLKDCPKGMELYSPLCGECRVLNIYDGLGFDVICGDNTIYNFSYDGRYNIMGECCIFPSKENRDWSKFQRPFKDGDIVFYSNTIAIFNEWGDETLFRTYCVLYTTVSNPMYQFEISIPLFGKGIRKEVRLATEEEKAKLFQAIKDNGLKWNAETKTLEKVPKIKDGDIIYIKTSSSEWISIFEKFDDDECKCYVNYCIDSDNYYGKIGGKKNLLCDIDEIIEQRLATEEEKQKLFDVIKEHGHQWNTKTKTLEKLIKFKIGDRIKKSDKCRSSIVVEIKDDCFIINGLHHSYLTDKLPFSIQDEYELVTDKFNINTLKPFQKVLVRDSDISADKEYWSINLFGFYNEITKQFHCMGNTNIGWNECIPYEGNEHLLGTTNNCDNYYKKKLRIMGRFDSFILGMLTGVILLAISFGIINFTNPSITPMDVYRGKTVLEITYKDSIPIDTIVVFKEEFKK